MTSVTSARVIRNMMNHHKGRLTHKQMRLGARRQSASPEEKKSKKLKRDIALARSRRQYKSFGVICGYNNHIETETGWKKPWISVNHNIGGTPNRTQAIRLIDLAEEEWMVSAPLREARAHALRLEAERREERLGMRFTQMSKSCLTGSPWPTKEEFADDAALGIVW